MQRHRPADPLDGLMAIGIDELSYRKGHKYVTTVTDQLSGQMVWAAAGKNAETLTAFFEELGEARCSALAVVTMDMSEAYITTQKVPQAQIVFDRFHVQQLVQRAGARNGDACGAWTSRASGDPWNLTRKQARRLSTLITNRAYLLKETFADILNRRMWSRTSQRVAELVAVGSQGSSRSLRTHLDEIVAYIRWGVTRHRCTTRFHPSGLRFQRPRSS